jgi:chorismate mutase/prephenate dehydratase
MKESNESIKDLLELRKKIDKIDNKIIKLLNDRGKIVREIGTIKKQSNLDIFQPEREKDVIQRMKMRSTILKNMSIEAIWREIIDACKLIQEI